MRVPEHPTQVRRMLDSRLRQMTPKGPVLCASLSEVRKRCGKAGCACHHGGALHTAHHLTFKHQGKTRTVYVPQGLVEEVRSWVEESRRLDQLRQEISQLALALVRTHAQHQKRKKGRP